MQPKTKYNFDSPLPSTSTNRNNINESYDKPDLKKTVQKTKATSKFARIDDPNLTLHSRFADLDIPTKKRASDSPMDVSMNKKSLLDALDQDYYAGNVPLKVALPTEELESHLRTDGTMLDKIYFFFP
jgi:hypothetical protein